MSDNTDSTLMFADIVDSSRLYGERGDERAQAIIRQGVELLSDIVAQYQGRVVKTIGDEVMAVFENAKSAVEAALFMQKAMQATKLSEEGDHLKVKIGLHTGPVIHKGGDVFGNTVNATARVVAQAKPLQILASKTTIELAGEGLSMTTRLIDHMNLKGIQDIFDIYEVLSVEEEDVENMTCMMDADEAALEQVFESARLVLSHGGKDVTLDKDHTSIRMGRESENPVVVDHKSVSRFHARIDWEKGRCVLTDQSINGTHVVFADGTIEMVHRDKLELKDSGYISLGVMREETSPDVVHFRAVAK